MSSFSQPFHISYQSGKEKVKYELSYDSHNNLTKVKLGSSLSVNYSFDAHDTPLSETVKDEFGSYQISYTYDKEGKIKALKLPDGSVVEYTYEGPFVKGTKRLSKDKNELYKYQVFARDLMGNILEEILPGNARQRKQVWDEAGRRIGIITDFFQDRVLEGGYDPLDNLRKRETTFDEKKNTVDYDYNALSQLISEKGEIQHTYSYDSLGNRLKKDSSLYKVDELNQLIEAEGASYTFDQNGNIATKTIGGKTWVYQTNPLNQIISITDPDQNVVKFIYDASGKRLSKRIEAKDKKVKIFRFFYLGDTEIGSVDENGVIVELKIPSNPNHPEATCIAIEIEKETYVPIYDLQDNIVCLVDHQGHRIVETYRYSVYGEEEITNERGKVLSDSSIGNPWRYRGKRIDKETGLICFGYRYYDAQVGRWVTPDPLGTIDGPNLYAYARNNPMTYVDYFGLAAEINEDLQPCVCGYCVRGEGFCHCMGSDPTHNIEGCTCRGISCIHKSVSSIVMGGSSITSALGGIGHGIMDFAIDSIHDLQTAAIYMGAEELELVLQERVQMIDAVEQSQANRMNVVESWMMNMLSVDQSDVVYQSFRSTTTMGLEIGSLLAGGYGAVKGVLGFSKLAKMPVQIAKLNAKGARSVEGALKVGKFTYTDTAAKHFTEFVKKGPNAGRLSRPYMTSQLTIEEIMTAGKPIPDPCGIPGGLRWGVSGALRGSEGTWELVIHPETNVIYHFNFK